MPAPYQEISGDDIAATLRHRRARLPAVAAAFYARLAQVVDVHGTDAAEQISVRQGAAGAVEVMLSRRAAGAASPHFERSFVPGETREVRVYLHGGDDSVAATGGPRARVLVRIIAGKGRDTLADPAEIGVRSYQVPGDSAWYPHDSLVEPVLDRRPWVAGAGGEREPPPADFGGRVAPSLSAAYVEDLGLVVKAGAELVRYRFRTEPWASRFSLGLTHATALGAWRAVVAADFSRESSPVFFGLSTAASGLERPWFFGLGNETARADLPADAFRVSHRRYDAGIEIGLRGRGWQVAAGPLIRYARSEPSGVAAAPLGRGSGDYGFAAFGVRAALGRGNLELVRPGAFGSPLMRRWRPVCGTLPERLQPCAPPAPPISACRFRCRRCSRSGAGRAGRGARTHGSSRPCSAARRVFAATTSAGLRAPPPRTAGRSCVPACSGSRSAFPAIWASSR